MAISYDLRPVGSCFARETDNVVVKESSKLSLIGLSQDEMVQALKAVGVPEHQTRMRVRQLWHWLYVRGVSNFDEMLNISKAMQETLKCHFSIARPEIVGEQISKDGTRKWLLRFLHVELEGLLKLKRFISLKKDVVLYVFHRK